VAELIDVLSELLRSAPPQGWIAEESSFRAPWSFRGSGDSATFYYVVHGCCWLELGGVEGGQSLGPGDVAAVMPGHAHSLRDSQATTTGREEPLEPGQPPKRQYAAGDQGARLTRLVCGGLLFDKHRADPLRNVIPAFSMVRGIGGKAIPALEQILRMIVQERAPIRPGGQLIVDHLVKVIFIQIIRAAVPGLSAERSSAPAGATDPDIGLALELMHAAPHAPWTVSSLADRVGLSRSVFAARFKTLTSKSPMQYLFEFRMGLACDLIAQGSFEVKQIAAQLGYATRDAFSCAFKRWKGLSPGAYRRLSAQRARAEDDAGP
jgi:AraC-like DNA-binding protein